VQADEHVALDFLAFDQVQERQTGDRQPARISRRTHASHSFRIRALRPPVACLARRSRLRSDGRVRRARARQQRNAGRAAEGRAANIAMIGEPQTLDPMASTADLVGTIMLHVYELLYTFDANWNVTPMLAESMPAISKDALVYTIPLRKGVKFHNGHEMTSDDVVASLRRWMDMAPRGKAVAKEIKSLEAKGPNSIVITLNRPYAPLLAHLALPNGFAAIMAKDSIATPLTQFVGTGPYMFKERKPDQYVQLVRFDGYSARSEPASGYAGKREALLDELRFIPVPNANTRVEGLALGAVPLRRPCCRSSRTRGSRARPT
jgi:ABC-type transport system substrate-binding protein